MSNECHSLASATHATPYFPSSQSPSAILLGLAGALERHAPNVKVEHEFVREAVTSENR
jgi:hypothetical protein